MLDSLKSRLSSLGFSSSEPDEPLLLFSLQKAESFVKSFCNLNALPDSLNNITVDLAAGEFLSALKTFSPNSLESLDLDSAVKQIKLGDTETVFAVGQGSSTPEQRLDSFINSLLSGCKEQLLPYRRLKW